MRLHFYILVILALITKASFSQTNTTYKNKSGNPVGYSKINGNKTTYYDKSHNKTGSNKSSNGKVIYYNKQGNKVATSKIK